MSFGTPVLFLIFNRPETTHKVFESIRRTRPSRLYIAGDGPRDGRSNEAELCRRARSVVDLVDWPCDVKVLFRDQNLGCKTAVSGSINWFFEEEERGIILEDDCLPHPDFFTFCQAMLEHYETEPRVMHIAGANFQMGRSRGSGSYYFSRYNHIWGWATWKRAWKHYDVTMSDYTPDKTAQLLKHIFKTRREIDYWRKIFSDVYNGKINTWDYQWTYALWQNDGVAIIPNRNLVSNIGFEAGGTHTVGVDVMRIGNMKTLPMPDLSHPPTMEVNSEADRFALNNVFYPTLAKYAERKLLNLIKR